MTHPDHLEDTRDNSGEEPAFINDVYSEAFGGEKIVVTPSESTRQNDSIHEEALEAARRRIGHLTGSVATKSAVTRGPIL